MRVARGASGSSGGLGGDKGMGRGVCGPVRGHSGVCNVPHEVCLRSTSVTSLRPVRVCLLWEGPGGLCRQSRASPHLRRYQGVYRRQRFSQDEAMVLKEVPLLLKTPNLGLGRCQFPT